MSQNGKGDKRRPSKAGAYARGYDAIDWSKGRTPVLGQWAKLTEGNPVVEELTPKERAILDEMVKRQEPTCGGCDGCTNPPVESHGCLYQEEIHGNVEFTCTCCDDCRYACSMRI